MYIKLTYHCNEYVYKVTFIELWDKHYHYKHVAHVTNCWK